MLGFPRDGTSRDKPGRDVPLSLCPGTKKFSCPGVPLSRDKGRSKCPGTNSSVPSRDKITFPKVKKKQEKDVPKQEKYVPKREKEVPKKEKRCSKTGKGRSETGNHRKKIVHLMYKIESDCVLGCDGTACKKSHHVLSRGKILNLSSCPFVLGQ